ncbi:uncharacterized protein LOC135945251 [Cloeon dipterum]|uniref:uncharacterized protein LOC135945251 n=1 Tax=Cloeon dipterum TaxID=197152 RepID=UPI00321FC736
MDGFRTFGLSFKLSKSEKTNISNISSDKYKSGDNRYPIFEDDDKQRNGKVFVVVRGVGDKSDNETLLHHWAIAVKFYDGKWVTIEGVIDRGLLVPAYSSSYSKPSGTIIDIEKSPSACIKDNQVLKYLLLFTQAMKSVSFESVRFIRASPRDLHRLACGIPKKPYCLGVNDCQTWFLDALRKLQFFEIGTKSTCACAFDLIRAPVKTVTYSGFKAMSTVTNTGLEALNTVGRVISLKENPVTALVDGVGKAANHIITGVYDTAAGAVDGVAGFAVNAIGLVTGGGCATKNGLDADMKSLQEEVDSGRMSLRKAKLQKCGKVAGSVVYKIQFNSIRFYFSKQVILCYKHLKS